jgi:hypothetical protein
MDIAIITLNNIMETVALIPKCLQLCMSFGGVTGICSAIGWFGCNLSIIDSCVNALHCIPCWENELNALISPVVGKMKEMLGLGAEGT